MPRPLKSFVTSVGFYDLAVAAPSMKAALDAWNAGKHLFQQGFAKETNDPAIVTATMAKPGVVLRRPVGTKGVFEEEVELPKMLPMDLPRFTAKTRAAKATKKQRPIARKPDPDADRKAQAAFEKAQKLRDDERRKEEAARERERARRKKAVEQAQAALDRSRSRHETLTDAIARDRAAVEKRAAAEEERWRKEEDRLREAVQRAWRR